MNTKFKNKKKEARRKNKKSPLSKLITIQYQSARLNQQKNLKKRKPTPQSRS
jgi:hypothetical protein